jgi:hypothetical protein
MTDQSQEGSPGSGSADSWPRSALQAVPAPSIPVRTAWSFGLKDLLLTAPRVPPGLARALGALDRLGQLSVTPDGLGFDGEFIAWSRIQEIRCTSALDLATVGGVERELARIASRLPPVPGRKWVVSRASSAITAIALAAVELAGSRFSQQAEGSRAASIPVTVVYRGALGRQREHAAGLFSSLACAGIAGVSEAIIDLARRHGVDVIDAPPPRSALYADQLRATAGALRQRLVPGQ